MATIQEHEVRENTEFDEAKVLQLLEKEAGKFKESSEAFAKAGREDQAAHMKACSELIQGLLPAKLEADAYPALVDDAVAATGASSMRDMGGVMAFLKKEHGAALDMKIASAAVKAKLG